MTFDPATVQAVIFDIGGVFIYPTYEPVEQRLQELGYSKPANVTSYRRAHHAAVRALATSVIDPTTIEVSDDYWLAYDSAYGQALGVDRAGIDELREAIRTGWGWVHDENVAAFHRLAETKMPLAIVSNNNGTAPEQMINAGVCQVGDGPLPSVAAIVDSTLVGIAKPDPRIFSPALSALGVEPSAALYVGDMVHSDVNGALAAGMQVVQLDPFDDHVDFEHSRAVDIAAIATSLVR